MDFVGAESNFMFDQLGYKKDFLALPVETWNDNNSFKEMNNYVTNLLVINDAGTIHKKTMCLRQKYPTYLTRSANTEFSTDFKYGGSSFFYSTASKWPPFFILSKLCSASAVHKKMKTKIVALLSCVILDEICDNLAINKKNLKKI